MREKLLPWMPAILCTAITLLTFASFVAMSLILNGQAPPPPMAWLAPFLSFLPMCFYQVGVFLSQLRQENRELRKQIQEMISTSGAEQHA